MFPLRHNSMVSMKKMQALQPEVKAIQERYAKYKVTDPERQKMNTEMMALYKQKGVNPASGCVPMLLTMPVLFAFYQMLASAIELRGAPFVGWINDLSQMDPLFITPVLMGGTMFWQQKMTPTTADPAQQKIFMVHAGDLHRDVPEGAERPRDLLAGEQPHDDRPAARHQLDHHCAARRPTGGAGGGCRRTGTRIMSVRQRSTQASHRLHHQGVPSAMGLTWTSRSRKRRTTSA